MLVSATVSGKTITAAWATLECFRSKRMILVPGEQPGGMPAEACA